MCVAVVVSSSVWQTLFIFFVSTYSNIKELFFNCLIANLFNFKKCLLFLVKLNLANNSFLFHLNVCCLKTVIRWPWMQFEFFCNFEKSSPTVCYCIKRITPFLSWLFYWSIPFHHYLRWLCSYSGHAHSPMSKFAT